MNNQIHGIPGRPKEVEYEYSRSTWRMVISALSIIVIIITFSWAQMNHDIFDWDDSEYVNGTIDKKYDNRGSLIYNTCYFEINGRRYYSGDLTDDYEVGDHFEGRLDDWSDPLVMDDMTEFVFFAFIMAIIVGFLGFALSKDKKVKM